MFQKYLWALVGPLVTVGSSYIYKPSVVDCARISHLVYHEQKDLNTQLQRHELTAYQMVSDIQIEETGMRVSAFKLQGTNNVVIAYRGTDPNNNANLLIDLGIAASVLESSDANSYFLTQHTHAWLEKHWSGLLKLMNNNAELLRYLPTNAIMAALGYWGYDVETGKKYKRLGIKHALDAFEQIKKDNPSCTYYITGHSLGGFYAQIIAYHYGHAAYTFNAPGAYQTYRQLYPEWARTLWWIRSKKLITNYIREHDLVGTFGTHLGNTKIIPNVDKAPENNPNFWKYSYNETLSSVYDLTDYARKNHSMAHVVEDFVLNKAIH